ncbi:electron transfer flavoprotein subunit beta/FixA family protein [Enterococcus hulanensis]|uniref:Electron transfer flavoprotein small subunit n=1 Tax=Enterococcus hulanensis TaxID=2559929 RepID=A0ABU3EVF8_9ENTE|nr:electron transfer flavoprotein subunit beta/FixA family protein [Enterococcus hulanensis]MDT2598857.1 electron transfer flavoprotein subunit beta/FixA family protein [Enterococcus hulanensis]MDT2607639.1 electron transfer flavoprotein subunit beta/FixA family protein [Enterococcus hulanensis]MDT2614934.1 electron transfer flavoprotein subunit beta/FixA family protein [Enterococcus hulanensis]MDT2627096.1 electron transfer flavoprotein subunit beta/FixA family protein [Enterococcus hulanensis
MKIICLVKYVPDTEKFEYDYETDKINRDVSRLILNPDDKNAVAFAMMQKKQDPSVYVEVVTMGPLKLEEPMKDFVRLGADHATLISDRHFAGSDSLVTSRIISRYLASKEYDLLLTGTHTLDGGTGHVGPQIAETMGINQFSNIVAINEVTPAYSIVEALQEEKIYRLKIENPSALSVTHQMNLRLGFVRYENIGRNVDDQFALVTNEDLQLTAEQIGGKGSPTKVRKNVVVKREQVEHKVVKVDDEGIDEVIHFLKEKGYL